MDINFELYKIFYHAATADSFSAAAEKLFISQSAVSQAIKNLEEKMGQKLFYRKARSVGLTQEGELLLQHVGQAYNLIKTAEIKILQMQNMESGEIRIGASDTICKYFLISYLEKFTNKYPKIKVRIISRTSSHIAEILKNGLIDFGIVTLPIDAKNLIVREFTSVEDIFVACDKFSFLKKCKIPLGDLSKLPLLMLHKNSATRRNFDLYLQQIGVSVAPEIELENIDLLVDLARIGLGVAHVLKESAEASIKNGEIFKVETVEKMPERRLGIISIKNVPMSRAAEEFIKSLTVK
jgi:DNA-binding transcriptional LysR family regulator